MTAPWPGDFEQVDPWRYRIPQDYKPGMRVPGLVFASPELVRQVKLDSAPEQVANVATLPGLVDYSLAMPDIHWGYGFCIGGVAASDPENGGVISPGGVGYDINCGVRLVRTNLKASDIAKNVEQLMTVLFRGVPAGVGRGGKYKFDNRQINEILTGGARWAVSQGLGWQCDLDYCEAGGAMADADPAALSNRACQRGHDQCGTLGSGNHFLELQEVVEIFDDHSAGVFGLDRGQLVVMIHSGSRGLGYQVCDDAIRELRGSVAKYGITLPDPQLVCAPVDSAEGRRYLSAMRSAANFAWANRQVLMHLVREIFASFFGTSAEDLGLQLVYDVAHNIAKMEHHEVHGKQKLLCVHRKGATRAFPPGHPELPARYKPVGQPVLIPGDMGRASYVLVGQDQAMRETFGSTCHGAGRVMSRSAAIRQAKGRSIRNELARAGVVALARGRHGLDEEQPGAYKDVSMVVDAVAGAGLSRKVARLKPLGVIKG